MEVGDTMNSAENTILFSIPDFWYHFRLNMALLNLMDKEPDKFYSDIKIDSCYGSFPCIWNGGRLMAGDSVTYPSIKSTLTPFIERGISIRHTFTNLCLSPKDFGDTLGNYILDFSNQHGRNGVTLTNLEFKKYIEDNYPNLYTVLSTTLDLSDIDSLNEATKTNLVVPSYVINNKFDILSSLKHPENVEILIGEECVDNCPMRKEHYLRLSKDQHFEPYEGPFTDCPNKLNTYHYYETVTMRNHYVSIDMIRDNYLPIGINKFKISGRRQPAFYLIEHYVNYFVKKEYKDDIRNKLLCTMYFKPLF